MASINLQEEFLTEVREHLQIMEKELLAVEKEPEKEKKALITMVFRSIHSIKGAAGFMGYKRISELSHAMETLLSMARVGELSPDPDFVDALLAGLDILKSMLDDLGTSNSVDITHICGRLSQLIDDAGSPRAKKEMETRVTLTDSGGRPVDFQVSEFLLRSIPTELTNLFMLKVNLHEVQKKEGITPVGLTRKLQLNGLILDSKLETRAITLSEDLMGEPLMYLILYATKLDRELVMGMAGFSENQIVTMDKGGFHEVKSRIRPGEKDLSRVCEEAEVEEEDGSKIRVDSFDFSDTVRINVDVLDRLMKLAGELVLVRNQQLLCLEKSMPVSRQISQRLDIVTTKLQETIMRTRMQPIRNLFDKLPRIVRDLNRKLKKQMEIVTKGNDVELDKTILETLADPFTHIIRNCCDHGIESPQERRSAGKPVFGSINVDASHEAGMINIKVRDDGRGIDAGVIREKALENGVITEAELARMSEKEILSLVMLPGFSTREKLSQVSGRGVGMDVVKDAAERLGGVLEIESAPGEGTTLLMRIPLTLAIIPCLVVGVGDYRYAIPQVNLVELVRLYDEDVYTKIECASDQEIYRLRDRLLPMVRLDEVLKRPEGFTDRVRREITEASRSKKIEGLTGDGDGSVSFAVVKNGPRYFGLIVDKVFGTEEIVVQPMHPAVKSLNIYSGATVMGDGKVALILDIEGISKHVGLRFGATGRGNDKAEVKEDTQTVLLFKSGPHEQFAVSLPMIRRIERIPAGDVEIVGDKQYVNINGVSTYILRLDRHLNVSEGRDREELLLLLPKHIKRPFGILMSRVVDITETTLDMNVESYMEDGLLGSAVLGNKMTLFLDIFRLIELAEPDWFADRRRNAPPPEEKKNILLVEDTSFFRHLVKGYLESDNYLVMTAENGKDALNMLKSKSFDMIVSDLEMPVMDGWRFVKHIKEDPIFRNIPAVALTALDSARDRDRAIKAGFDAYEIKLDREKLLSNLSRIMGEL